MTLFNEGEMEMPNLSTLVLKFKNSVTLYTTALMLTLVLYGLFLIISINLGENNFIQTFFFKAWGVQFVNSWLFITGLLYIAYRLTLFNGEWKIIEKIILPPSNLYQENVQNFIKAIPKDQNHTIVFCRFRLLLQGFLLGEDIIRLNEELSRRDLELVEQGHVTLNNLKNLCPIIGFLGTVIGLSLGMQDFPDLASLGQNLEGLKKVLISFAGNLSVAFNTTLLGLVHAVILTLLSSWLFSREVAQVKMVDEKSRALISKMKGHICHSPTSEIFEAMKRGLQVGLDRLADLFQQLELGRQELAEVLVQIKERLKLPEQRPEEPLLAEMRRQGELVCQKLEEIRQNVQQPPQYQVVVQPLKG